jgi:hypothetical protein
MTEERFAALEAAVAQILALMRGDIRSDVRTVGPGVFTVGGATMNLLEPLAVDWEPSHYAREMTKYGKVGDDPSNGDGSAAYPRRSLRGYPFVYATGVSGPVGHGVIAFAGQTFADDNAVAAFKKRMLEPSQVVGTSGTFGPKA